MIAARWLQTLIGYQRRRPAISCDGRTDAGGTRSQKQTPPPSDWQSLRNSGKVARFKPEMQGRAMATHDHDHNHQAGGSHGHGHDHAHDHAHGSDLSEFQLRVRALETVLTEKGYIEPAALDRIVEAYETRIGPHVGARVVARAWVDPAFKASLLADASQAITALGIENKVGDHLVAVENTPKEHHIVVCTLCSCYPWDVLGLPPVWYKSFAYRSRTVKDPRGVLSDFGLKLPDTTAIRVWDSTAEMRFMVVPLRPAGTDGWSEERLAKLVTRDSMVGTGVALDPKEVTA
jgi:nitrile hydratase subunit alpha